MDFEWDDDNLDHIARHGVEPEEAEDAVLDPNAKPEASYSRSSEWRQVLIGKVGSRILFVVTARDASEAEKQRYRRLK
jgi:uncharacterized protein